MKLDLARTSLFAALCSTPFASKLIFSNDRTRQKTYIYRSHFFDNHKSIRRIYSIASQNEGPNLPEKKNLSILNPDVFSEFRNFINRVLISSVTIVVISSSQIVGCYENFLPSLSNCTLFSWLSREGVSKVHEIAQSADVNRLTNLEETVTRGIRKLNIQVDQFVEKNQPESSNLTKEDRETKQQMIREVWETVNAHYYNTRDPNFSREKWAKLRDEALSKQLKTKDSAYRIIRNMLENGLNDPYARITPKEEFSKLEKYDMTGVGLNLGSSTEYVQKTSSKPPGSVNSQAEGIWVLGLIKDSVSDVAGVKIGDQIIEVDGISVSGASSFQAARMIKGTSDQPTVSLKIRKREGDLKEVTLGRSTTKSQPAVKKSVERVREWRKVGRIKVVSCTAQARDEVLNALQELKHENVKEVILDLRENRGGLVLEGVEIAKLFLDQGSTVMVSRQSSDRRDTPYVANESATSDVRLVVQVGPETASAAEIIAGALQDNCRGVIVGDRTYGKGLIQSVYALSDGSGLTLTVGHYLTPNMTNIDQSGINPDFKMIPNWKKQDKALDTCRIIRKQNGTGMRK